MSRAERRVRLLDEIFPTRERLRCIFERDGGIGEQINFVWRAVFVRQRNPFKKFADDGGRINESRQRNFFEINPSCPIL